MASDPGYTGQKLLWEFWYLCDVCGIPMPGSRTTRFVRSRAQAGLRVCDRCLDDPGRDDLLDEWTDNLRRAQRGESETKPP